MEDSLIDKAKKKKLSINKEIFYKFIKNKIYLDQKKNRCFSNKICDFGDLRNFFDV